MGKSGSGKTSMRSIIFANYIARDTRRLGATSMPMLSSIFSFTYFALASTRKHALHFVTTFVTLVRTYSSVACDELVPFSVIFTILS